MGSSERAVERVQVVTGMWVVSFLTSVMCLFS